MSEFDEARKRLEKEIHNGSCPHALIELDGKPTDFGIVRRGDLGLLLKELERLEAEDKEADSLLKKHEQAIESLRAKLAVCHQRREAAEVDFERANSRAEEAEAELARLKAEKPA